MNAKKTDAMAKKDTKKAIKAQLINEVAAQYNHRAELWKGEYEKMRKACEKAENERKDALERALKAENELAQYKDWVERLQDFCNLSDEDREKAIAKMRADSESEAKYAAILDNIGTWGKLFWLIGNH